MTREEAIKRFENQLKGAIAVLDSGFGTHPGESNRLYRDRKEMAQFAIAALREQEQRRWIPVAERLPGNDDFVLVITSGNAGNITLDNAIELASFSMDEGWILEMWPEWEDPKVTYWMPLPEPPEEDV